MRWSNDSRLDSGLRDLRPGWVNVPCLYAKLFTFTVHLSTQEYKWVVANCRGSLMKCWGSNLGIKWHPIQGGVVILLVASGHGKWDKPVTWFAYYYQCFEFKGLRFDCSQRTRQKRLSPLPSYSDCLELLHTAMQSFNFFPLYLYFEWFGNCSGCNTNGWWRGRDFARSCWEVWWTTNQVTCKENFCWI